MEYYYCCIYNAYYWGEPASPTLASWMVDFPYIYIYIYIYYYISAVGTSFRKFRLTLLTRNIAHADPCGQNSEAPKSAREQEDRWWRRKKQSPMCCRDSRPEERKVEKLRVRDRARRATQTASERQATLRRKSTWKKGNETSEERKTRLEQMRDRLAAEKSEERDWRY